MKYCIGCVHLSYQRRVPGAEISDVTYDPSIDAKLACANGFWELFLDEDTKLLDIESAMEFAEQCPQFSERPPVRRGAEP